MDKCGFVVVLWYGKLNVIVFYLDAGLQMSTG